MVTITGSIDDDVLRRARAKAAMDGASVGAVIADYLTRYAELDESTIALAEIIELAVASDSGSEPGGRRWNREQLHERAGRAGGGEP